MSKICDNGIIRDMTEEEQANYDKACADAKLNEVTEEVIE